MAEGKIGKYFGVGNNANRDKSTWKSTLSAVSVGDSEKKYTRQITNLAAGTNPTDAVNVAQLKSLKYYSDKTFINKNDLDLDGTTLNIKWQM